MSSSDAFCSEVKRRIETTLGTATTIIIFVAILLFASPSDAQQKKQNSTSDDTTDPLIECQLTRQADVIFAGKCFQPKGVGVPGTLAAGETFQLRLAPPAASEPNLWRGTVGSDKNGWSPVAVDQAGAYRWMRYWAEVRGVQLTTNTFHFSFDPAATVEPTEDDLEILRRARKYLDDPAHWSHKPDADVYAAATAFAKDPNLSRRGFCPATGPRTLFCALYSASIEQTGEFWWGRPAMNAVRAAVLADDSFNQQHPLMQFNGEAERKLSDVQRVLDVAIAYVKVRQNCSIQPWVWGTPISHKCR